MSESNGDYDQVGLVGAEPSAPDGDAQNQPEASADPGVSTEPQGLNLDPTGSEQPGEGEVPPGEGGGEDEPDEPDEGDEDSAEESPSLIVDESEPSLPVERSGLSFPSHDELNPAYAAKK